MEVSHNSKSEVSFFSNNACAVTHSFEDFPEELLKYIFSFLDPRKRESWNVILVSTQFCRVGREALDPSFEGNRWLIAASKLDKVITINWLLSDERVTQLNSIDSDEELEEVELSSNSKENSLLYALIEMSRNGHVDLVKRLLETRIDPSKQFQSSTALEAACSNQQLEVVEILLKDKRIDPSYLNNNPLDGAIRCNDLDIIVELMKDKRVRVSELMLCNACHLQKDPDVLEQLLKDPNLAFSINNNVVLENAIQFSNLAIFKVLMNDNRIKTNVDWNRVLNLACRYGKLDIVKEILTMKSVDLNRIDESLDFACLNGHLDVVKELLKHGCDPSKNGNRAILYASKAEIVRELLKDPRVDPSDLENRAFARAHRNKNHAVCKALLEDSRVNGSEAVKALLQKSQQ